MGKILDRDPAHRFQEVELKKLSLLSYHDLSTLRGRVDIPSPKKLESFQFAREITSDKRGILEVNVFHYWVPDVTRYSIAGIEATVGECRSCRKFWMDPKGNIEWPDDRFDPDD